MANRDGMLVTLAGSVHMPYPVSIHDDSQFLGLVDLFHESDAVIASIEGVIRVDEDWPVLVPGMEGGNSAHFFSPPSALDELKFLGVTALCMANNHACDFGDGGYLTSIKYLREKNMPFSGIGASLTEASMPCYAENARGRIALVSVAEFGPQRECELPVPPPIGQMPSDDVPPFRSRPGMNLVSYDVVNHVDSASFEALRGVSDAFAWERGKISRREGAGDGYYINRPRDPDWERDSDDVLFFMGRKFVRDEEFRTTTFAYEDDVERVSQWVREARMQADIVVVIYNYVSHSHVVAEYAKDFGRRVIDAGADIFDFRAGAFKGVEMYKGRPMFYGGAPLYVESHRMTHISSAHLRHVGLPPGATAGDFMRERKQARVRAVAAGAAGGIEPGPSILKSVQFDRGGVPVGLFLHPIEMHQGYPRLVEPGAAEASIALERAAERSEALGVRFVCEKGIATAALL